MTVALTSIKISTDFDSGNIQVLDASDAVSVTAGNQAQIPAANTSSGFTSRPTACTWDTTHTGFA